MKKLFCIAAALIAVAVIFFALKKNDAAHSYIYTDNMPESIPVSYRMPLNFKLFREYDNERVTVKVYSGKDGSDAADKEPEAVFTESIDMKDDSIREIRFVWETPATPGDYVAEYCAEYYSGGKWNEAGEKLYAPFTVVYPCGEHTFTQNADSVYGTKGVSSDCYTKGIAYRLCSVCGYEESFELETSHVYGSAVTVSGASCTTVGYRTYKCNKCEETKVEIIEADTDKHHIRAVEKVEATATRPGSVWFECSNCNYVEPYKTETPALFMEIDPALYYEKPVSWAYEKDVFSTVKGYEFEPNDECSKATALSLIYVANGVGVTQNDVNPFVDVAEGDYFRDAAKWAYKYGIVQGDEFEPNLTCTRGMLVEYLWRMSGSPVVNQDHNFTDVPEDASYSEAVSWAVSEGIASGMDEGIFNPDWSCTQAQVITFLYRIMND